MNQPWEVFWWLDGGTIRVSLESDQTGAPRSGDLVVARDWDGEIKFEAELDQVDPTYGPENSPENVPAWKVRNLCESW